MGLQNGRDLTKRTDLCFLAEFKGLGREQLERCAGAQQTATRLSSTPCAVTACWWLETGPGKN